MIHRKKNRPALQSHDILTIFVVFVVVVVVVDRGMCSSIQLFPYWFYSHQFAELFVRSSSTALFFLVLFFLALRIEGCFVF